MPLTCVMKSQLTWLQWLRRDQNHSSHHFAASRCVHGARLPFGLLEYVALYCMCTDKI